MKEDIFKKYLEKIVNISKEFGAKKVFLFGSCLEDISSCRDIDILQNVYLNKNSDF
jgi:predicted nucleotidyltransferase